MQPWCNPSAGHPAGSATTLAVLPGHMPLWPRAAQARQVRRLGRSGRPGARCKRPAPSSRHARDGAGRGSTRPGRTRQHLPPGKRHTRVIPVQPGRHAALCASTDPRDRRRLRAWPWPTAHRHRRLHPPPRPPPRPTRRSAVTYAPIEESYRCGKPVRFFMLSVITVLEPIGRLIETPTGHRGASRYPP